MRLLIFMAQCALCKAAVANAENAGELSRTMDAAVLVLLIPTVALFGALVGIVFRRRHSRGGEWPGRDDSR